MKLLWAAVLFSSLAFSGENLTNRLTHGWPNAQWTMSGDDYSTLQWVGPGKKPSKEEILLVAPTRRYRAKHVILLPSGAKAEGEILSGNDWTPTDITFLQGQGYVVQEVN